MHAQDQVGKPRVPHHVRRVGEDQGDRLVEDRRVCLRR
jgi:hypothetical protein